MSLPRIPCSFKGFPAYLEQATSPKAVAKAVEPFKSYEARLRQIYAQEPTHPCILQNHLVPVYQDGKSDLTIKARDLSAEDKNEQEKYLLPLSESKRRKQGSRAVTATLKEFKKNFSLFSEASLADLNWDNVVAAGSSVVTALLPVDAPHNESKRALRSYYHETLAPASDVDLFIYGLDEEQAIEKIKRIEANVRDAILCESTVVRTKNAITIVSEYPTRHIQIVLRIYNSVSEILTGFDVDCACVAYDGKQVWAAPRALAAFATQMNTIDLTRRSPSYENRLSKYSHRGFEVYWPLLDRSKVDPTIFERAFNRVLGLARLLVLEQLPHPQDRDEYLTKRREERGRPQLPWNARFRNQLPGNVKDAQPDDVAEWYAEDDISSYHTFTIPYGPRYTPKKIERLLFSKDLLLNAEFNKPKDRVTDLHRHPAFFGRVEDVIHDCCGYCPKPVTDEDLAAYEEESKIFISGDVSFLKDDPGRQEIGSFHPLTDDDWTEMAYIGNTTQLCQAIVSQDLEAVIDWFSGEGADVNKRDHTGRTPLQLAVMCSTPEIVRCLIERGARIVARLYNGLTALHLASHRGEVAMVQMLLDKSEENAAEEEKKEEARKVARRAAAGVDNTRDEDVRMTQAAEDEDVEEIHSDDVMADDTDADDSMTEGSFVKVSQDTEPKFEDEKTDDPDVYDVDVVAWDSPVSALHLAIMAGHQDVIRVLIDKYGADVMLPVKLMTNQVPKTPKAAILTLLLPLELPLKKAHETVKTLLEKNASPLQADMNGMTAIQHIVYEAKTEVLKAFQEASPEATAKAINHLSLKRSWRNLRVDNPLLSAIRSGSLEMVEYVLSIGAKPVIELEDFARAYKALKDGGYDEDNIENLYQKSVTQPIIAAARDETMAPIVARLLDQGADVDTLTAESWAYVQGPRYNVYNPETKTVIDLIRAHSERLQKFADDKPVHKPTKLEHPEALKEDEYYLKDMIPNTYRHWVASKDLERAKFIQAERAKKYQHDFDTNKEPTLEPGEEEKRQAASRLAQSFLDLEQKLKEKGGRTFYEIYPHLKEEKDKERSLYQRSPREEKNDKDDSDAVTTKFDFTGKDATPSKVPRYIELFEAAFAGDAEKVKALCLPTETNTKPLQASVKDLQGFSIFSIALSRGHFDLARMVLDITAAQYHEEGEPRLQYSLQPYDDDDSDSDDGVSTDSKPYFFKTLVDDNFTVDDIVAAQEIKANVQPVELINSSNCEIWRVMEVDMEHALHQCRVSSAFNPSPYVSRKAAWAQFAACRRNESYRSQFSLWKLAVVTNNVKMLKFLLDMEVKYSFKEADETLNSLGDRLDDLKHAMNLGHVEIVDSIIRSRGSLLPLHHLAARSGIVIQETPRYYQGLSVYGQKRKDWAKQDEHANSVDKSERGSPILDAIMDGNLDIIDYFMSDTLMRRYEEFAHLFEKDRRIRVLARTAGGIQGALRTWMSTRSNLVIHAAVMSWPAGSNQRLKYLMSKVPKEYLEVRSATGDTPLHTAIRIGNLPAFETLLAAGADQRTRDRKGHNLLHTIYQQATIKGIALFRKKVSLLDPNIVSDLVTQRCSGTEPGSLTPLALYLTASGCDVDVLKAMLEISQTKDLTVMNGAGDYPLHVEVRKNRLEIAEFLAKERPDLLSLENATGMTPIEVAETHYFQTRMDDAPSVGDRSKSVGLVDKPAKDFVEKQDSASESEASPIDDDDDLPVSCPLYATLVRIARQKPHARKLVSILDANEVARRLASQQHRKNAQNRRDEAQGLKARWNRYSRYPDDSDDGDVEDGAGGRSDEISRNRALAERRYNCVPWLKHAEDTREDVEAGLQKFRDFADGKLKTFRCCEFAESRNRYVRESHSKMTSEIEEAQDL